jgi:glucose-6-phosphate isomerase
MSRIAQEIHAGALASAYESALQTLAADRALPRLVARDTTLWSADPAHAAVISNRLGWLDAPAWMAERVAELQAFAAEARSEGITHVLLLGMGGSSLAPEVLEHICVSGPGAPTLDVLDSTDPAAVLTAESASRLDRTLFLVASKSGKTIETLSQYRYFRSRLESLDGVEPGRHFAAVTDSGSQLEALARRDGFRRVFLNPADVGGRYSALTYFGLVPAALLGLDLPRLGASAAAERAAALDPAPGVSHAHELGAFLGAMAREGRDKMTLLTSPSLRPLGYWIEQLVAESTGKEGQGIVPVEGEPLGPGHRYGSDRTFVSILLEGEAAEDVLSLEAEMRRAGAPCARLVLPDRDQVAGAFYRWEIATAIAGAVLGVDPFDEPNVQESKDKTASILADLEKTGTLPSENPRAREEGIEIFASDAVWEPIVAGIPSMPSLEQVLSRFLAGAAAGEYVAILAYLERNAAAEAAFALVRRAIRNAIQVPALQGYGPRYLHSIGQLHKGGPKSGMFLEITASAATDVAIPGESFTFGQLELAQAIGDSAALAAHGKRVLRLHLTQGVEPGLRAIAGAAERALAALQGA